MVPFFEELYGDNGAQSKLPQDLVDELNRQVSEAGGYPAENKKAAVDGVFAISAGKTIVHSIDALADAILANDKYIKEDDFDDSVGSLPSDAYPDGLAQCVMDADYDGICDRCNGSVFEDPKEGAHIKRLQRLSCQSQMQNGRICMIIMKSLVHVGNLGMPEQAMQRMICTETIAFVLL